MADMVFRLDCHRKFGQDGTRRNHFCCVTHDTAAGWGNVCNSHLLNSKVFLPMVSMHNRCFQLVEADDLGDHMDHRGTDRTNGSWTRGHGDAGSRWANGSVRFQGLGHHDLAFQGTWAVHDACSTAGNDVLRSWVDDGGDQLRSIRCWE